MKRQLANQVNSRHARIILLSRGGLSNRQIAERVDCTPAWVRKVLHRFNAGGLPAITWYPGLQVRGAPRKFTADITEQIAEVALSSPKALIGMNQWSLPKLRAYLREQKIVASISLEWLRQVLRRRGVRWRRTKTWKESTDPDFWAKYRRIRRLYRRRPLGGRRLCVDEFGPLSLQPRHGHCYLGPGHSVERLRATYTRRGGVRHFLAAYDLETDRLVGRFFARKTCREFLAFLQWLRRRYRPGETLHLVLDNFSPHLKAEVLQWARTHNVRFYFTPTNASWLNRIEAQFTAVSKFALKNSDFRTHEEQQQAITCYLSWRNRHREISLQSWHAFKRHQRRAA
jgi:transposase